MKEICDDRTGVPLWTAPIVGNNDLTGQNFRGIAPDALRRWTSKRPASSSSSKLRLSLSGPLLHLRTGDAQLPEPIQHSMRIPRSLYRHLSDCVPEFAGLAERDQRSLAAMLWMCTDPRRRHTQYRARFSLTKKTVEKVWGSADRMRQVVGWRYFRVLKGSNLGRGYTHAYFPIADVAEALRRCMVDPAPDDWLDDRGRVEDWKSKVHRYDGLIYFMGWRDGGQFVPLYVGKSETIGKGDRNLSANIRNLNSDRSKFARWGDNYA